MWHSPGLSPATGSRRKGSGERPHPCPPPPRALPSHLGRGWGAGGGSRRLQASYSRSCGTPDIHLGGAPRASRRRRRLGKGRWRVTRRCRAPGGLRNSGGCPLRPRLRGEVGPAGGGRSLRLKRVPRLRRQRRPRRQRRLPLLRRRRLRRMLRAAPRQSPQVGGQLPRHEVALPSQGVADLLRGVQGAEEVHHLGHPAPVHHRLDDAQVGGAEPAQVCWHHCFKAVRNICFTGLGMVQARTPQSSLKALSGSCGSSIAGFPPSQCGARWRARGRGGGKPARPSRSGAADTRVLATPLR